MRPRYHGITIAVTLALFAFLSVLGGSAEARGEGHEGGEHGSGGFGDRGHMGGEHVGGVRGDRDHPGVVGDDWYGHDAPVYPYPDPYVPTAAASGYWYYCGSARAYYPYVGACPEGWTPVVPR